MRQNLGVVQNHTYGILAGTDEVAAVADKLLEQLRYAKAIRTMKPTLGNYPFEIDPAVTEMTIENKQLRDACLKPERAFEDLLDEISPQLD